MRHKIDEKDRKIIEILQGHSDYTTRQIAKKTLLPVTTIHNRIRKLKKEKIIRKYTIEVEPKAVDKSYVVYVLIHTDLGLLKKRRLTQYDVAKELRGFYFIDKVDIVSGGADLVVIVRVKDVEEYDRVLLKKIQMVEGIKGTQSLTVIHGG